MNRLDIRLTTSRGEHLTPWYVLMKNLTFLHENYRQLLKYHLIKNKLSFCHMIATDINICLMSIS